MRLLFCVAEVDSRCIFEIFYRSWPWCSLIYSMSLQYLIFWWHLARSGFIKQTHPREVDGGRSLSKERSLSWNWIKAAAWPCQAIYRSRGCSQVRRFLARLTDITSWNCSNDLRSMLKNRSWALVIRQSNLSRTIIAANPGKTAWNSFHRAGTQRQRQYLWHHSMWSSRHRHARWQTDSSTTTHQHPRTPHRSAQHSNVWHLRS